MFLSLNKNFHPVKLDEAIDVSFGYHQLFARSSDCICSRFGAFPAHVVPRDVHVEVAVARLGVRTVLGPVQLLEGKKIYQTPYYLYSF